MPKRKTITENEVDAASHSDKPINNALTVKEIRARLLELGLSTDGLKAEILSRLEASTPAAVRLPVSINHNPYNPLVIPCICDLGLAVWINLERFYVKCDYVFSPGRPKIEGEGVTACTRAFKVKSLITTNQRRSAARQASAPGAL